MRDKWLAEWTRLSHMTDVQQRGYEFEKFVESLLRREHFNVPKRFKPANQRQVDLVASLGNLHLLIETKWHKNKVGVPDISDLLDRLRAASPLLIGVLVSKSGFTSSINSKVIDNANWPILLVSGDELESVLNGGNTLYDMLQRKLGELTRRQHVLLNEKYWIFESPGTALPDSPLSIRLTDGNEVPFWESNGGFDPIVFALDLDDIDWVLGSGAGVALDLYLQIRQQSELVALLHMLAHLGWLTGTGMWRIGQSIKTWNGAGPVTLAEQLEGWQSRYADRKMHHFEQVIYTDVCDGGFYTLVAIVSADAMRQVTHCRLSFQFSGIPLDLSPLHTLVSAFPVLQPPYFRPRKEASVSHHRLTESQEMFSPRALLVRSDIGYEDREDWVVGVILDDPENILTPEDRGDAELPRASMGQWLCALGDWHLAEKTHKYHLGRMESAHTTDARVLRVCADWSD